MWSLKRKRVESDAGLPPPKLQEQEPILDNPASVVIETTQPFLSDEPKFMQHFDQWTSHALYIQGAMGTGKTRFMVGAIAQVLAQDPNARVVYLNPYNGTSTQIFSALHAALPAGTPIAIHTDIHTAQVDWRVLVCHPRSLYRFDLRVCSMLIIDELSAFNEQLISWDLSESHVRESVEKAQVTLSLLVPRAARLVLCCAQISDKQIRLFNELASIKRPMPTLLYRSLHKPALTELVVINSHDCFLAMIWDAVINDKRIAVAVGTAASARRHDTWLRKKIHEHNRTNDQSRLLESFSTVWSAETLRHVGKARITDVTRYLTDQGTRALFYTSALSPGMSIEHPFGYWTHRCLHLCKNTGPSLNIIAQILNRVRKLTDHSVFCYIEPRSAKPPIDEKKISSEYLRTHPSAVESVIGEETGHVQASLKNNYANELRLDLLRERQLTSPAEIMEALQQKLDNARVTMRIEPACEPCPVWAAVSAAKKPLPDVAFHTHREVEREGALQRASNRAGRRSAGMRDRHVLDLRRCLPVSLLPVDQRYLNLHPKTSVFQRVMTTPRALESLRLMCTIDPCEFNTMLDIRLQLIRNESPDADYISLHDRIYTTEVFFLLSRLLLRYQDIVDALDAATLVFVRSELSYAHYDYLLGDYTSIIYFMRVHGPMITNVWSKARRAEFKEVLAGTKPFDPAFRLALFRLCCSQAGIGLNANHSEKLRHSANNPWKAIGVRLDPLVESIKNPTPIIDQYSLEACADCQTGELTECLRQDGRWVCTSAPSIAVGAHRDLYSPLDEIVNHTDTPGEQQESLADSILEVCGYTGGTQSQLQLSRQEIETSWASNCLLRQELLEKIDAAFGTKLRVMSQKTRKSKEIVDKITPILGAAGVTLKLKQKQVNLKRTWRYVIKRL